MFGNNPVRKRTFTDGQQLSVQEMFYTIQGEGPSAGTPATFVRLWGCHLRCWFCDTDFESNNTLMRTEDIVNAVCALSPLVVLTGGEPMRQNLVPLVKALIDADREVQIETAGSFWWQAFEGANALYNEHYRNRWSFVVSPKTPTVDKDTAEEARAFKYVICAGLPVDEDDGLPVVNYQDKEGRVRRLARPPWIDARPQDVFLQPMDECSEMRNEANRALCAQLAMRHGYRVSLQMHKLLKVP